MEGKGYTEAQILTMAEKIRQNRQEDLLFEKNLHSLLSGDKRLASRPLVIGKTPNIFAVCNKNINSDNDLVIKKKVIEKCMRPELRDENGMRLKNSGHYLSEEQLAKALESIKEPVMVLKGSLENTFVAITDFKDNKGKEIIVSIEINKSRAFGEVNEITSAYGREDFSQYIKDNLKAGNIIAINIEKADKMLLSIGVDFPEENTFISFDNTIAYSTESVKYPKMENQQNQQSQQKISGKEAEAASRPKDRSGGAKEKGSMVKKAKERSEKKSLLGNLAEKNKSKKKKNSDNDSPNTMGGR